MTPFRLVLKPISILYTRLQLDIFPYVGRLLPYGYGFFDSVDRYPLITTTLVHITGFKPILSVGQL